MIFSEASKIGAEGNHTKPSKESTRQITCYWMKSSRNAYHVGISSRLALKLHSANSVLAATAGPTVKLRLNNQIFD